MFWWSGVEFSSDHQLRQSAYWHGLPASPSAALTHGRYLTGYQIIIWVMCDPRLLYIRMTSIINYYSAFQCLIGQAALAMHNNTRHSAFCDRASRNKLCGLIWTQKQSKTNHEYSPPLGKKPEQPLALGRWLDIKFLRASNKELELASIRL